MRKIYLLLFAFVVQFSFSQTAGDIVSTEQKLNLTPEGIASAMFNGDTSSITQDIIDFIASNSTGLVAYKLTYYTPNYQGKLVKATGLVMYPKVDFRLSTILYCHPTTDNRNNVPSNLKDVMGFGFALPLSYALSGYIVVAPDYLGMANGDGIHPYVNAKTEASASIDFMKAANKFLATQAVKRYDENFITGYSQGGHAVMSVMKANKEKYSNLYNFKYSYPGAGPYDMSYSTFQQGVLDKQTYPNSAFLAYVINSCNYIGYKQYQTSYTEIIAPEYQATYQDKVINEGGGLSWGPSEWRKLFKPEFLTAVTNNASHPLRLCLKESDVYNWYNKTSTTMGYASLDKTINPANATKTRDAQRSFYSWWDLSKYNIDASDLGGLDHGTGAIPWLFASIYKFNNERSGGFFNEWAWITGKNASTTKKSYAFSYSRIDPVLSIKDNTAIADSEITIKRLNSKNSASRISENETGFKNLNKGIYFIEIKDKSGAKKMYPFVKENPVEVAEREIIKSKDEKSIVVNLSGLTDVQEVNIFDENLNRVKTINPNSGDSESQIEISDLKSGNYTVEVATKSTSLASKVTLGNLNSTVGKLTANFNNNELRVLSSQDISSVSVYDMNGKLVKQVNGLNSKDNSIDVTINKGVYIIKVNYTNGKSETTKILK